MAQWQIDYALLESQLPFPEEQLGLFALPLRGAWILLALSEWATWRGSYSDEFTDEEWDKVEALAERTRGQLMSYATVDDLLAVLEEIRDAIGQQGTDTEELAEWLEIIAIYFGGAP